MKKATALCVFSLAYAASAFAQSVAGLGAVSGTVRDATGASIPGAQVIVVNESKGIRRTLNTTEGGLFSAPSLVPATGYSVTVTKEGFNQYQLKELQVLV